MTNPPNTASGQSRVLSADEVKQLDELRAQFKPEESAKRLDSFSKWLFASVATVGTLGAGFSNAAFQTLSGDGKGAFALAIAAVGLSLAFAAIGMAPKLAWGSPNSIESMRKALAGQIIERQRYLQFASVLLAIALVLAALAPLLSSLPPRTAPTEARTWFSYALAADGKLTVTWSAAGLAPRAPIELGLVTEPAAAAPLLPRARVAAGDDGTATVQVELGNVQRIKGRLYAHGRWSAASPGQRPAEPDQQRTLEIALPRR